MIESKGFVVEAWFHNCGSESIFELLCDCLTMAGFGGVNKLTAQTISWDCITLFQHKVFFALSTRTEDHLVVTIQSRLDWDEGYSTFEQIFLYLLDRSQHVQIAELLLSHRNSQPYPFLTHSFHQGSPTIINIDEGKITRTGDDSYWAKWEPELHFIAAEVFERTQVDVVSFAAGLAAEIISLEGGILLDCGWTSEFPLPRLSSI
jgi:hypothetical protein